MKELTHQFPMTIKLLLLLSERTHKMKLDMAESASGNWYCNVEILLVEQRRLISFI